MTIDISKSIDACAAHYGADANAMRDYLLQGQVKALQMDNRGPLEFTADGRLSPTIRAAYRKYGFYILVGAIGDQELADIRADLDDMANRFPVSSSSTLTASGEPALGVGHKAPNLIWSKPLADPLGGTAIANGRHQVKLFEPDAAADAPKEAPFVMLGSLQFSEACLRVYAHPGLLAMAADINGDDFAPFHEGLFLKEPGIGAAVSWHQDGDTHWDNPQFDEEIHGFNFMAQAYGSTAVNGVWVVPGTHKQGKIDIKKLVDAAGSERINNAVPLVCDAGDVVICNRQLVHGSFANTGFERRISVNFGFHRRSSVLDVMGAGIHSEAVIYDADFIRQRSKVLGYAIEARKQRFPDELAYEYQLHRVAGDVFSWSADRMADLKDYNLRDLSI
jgi:ectoine hydroxylase-related dioxygenase (phytanoyl-CoA dioxygenase family)